ncbi:hypothetical protein Poli38472_011048 [Pythium oligandrum]|uniref:Uncharacterized protein n=1 Tax=Pythium oligandrum TaxID=41045 RepID=A0A8K1CR30_PYTOL|nr:hypothetical protein Poli38472_011048 [Pythium oligandrum]|eukprot:TMW67428.1 hypothetical protein Poli38472_011048 [Pythium oligandrum]
MKVFRSLCKLSALTLLLAAATATDAVDARGISAGVAHQRALQANATTPVDKCGVKKDDGSTEVASDADSVTQRTTKPIKTPTPKTKSPKPSKTPKPTKTPKPVKTPTSTPSGEDDDDADTPTPSATTVKPTTTPAPSEVDDDDDGDVPVPTADEDEGDTTPAPAASSTAPSPSATPAPSASATPSTGDGKLCAVPKVTVTEIDVGASVEVNEDEAALKLIAIAAKPAGGSYAAFHSGGKVNVVELDASDKVVAGSTVSVDVNDFADIHADAKGFVILGTRDAEGGGTLNCGNPSNLCGTAPNPAVPCYDMYLIRFEGGKETWATKLTSSSASLPPYSTSKTGANVFMIWWYAHHGRIAYDGTNWASYFGAAISTSEGGCINIHQGDRMQMVGPTGSLVKSSNAFDWGCSHSGYERIVYDDRSKEFTMICKTDNNNRIKFPNAEATVYPVDLAASNLGDIVKDEGGSGYWMTVSNGQGNNAKVHLMHFNKNKATDKDITLTGGQTNERACHLASIGSGGLLAAWEGSSAGGDFSERSQRQMFIQVRDAKDGAEISDVVKVDGVTGNRYEAFKSFPDGSVAYVAKGSSATKLKVLRITPC